MNIKMGDLVVRKGEINDLLFRVTGFEGEYAVLKGVRFPIITICSAENLIKLNRKRESNITTLRRVK